MTVLKVQLLPAERQTVFALASITGLRLMGLFMILPVFALYMAEFKDTSPLKIGLALGIYGLTQVLFQFPLGRLSDRFGRKPLIFLGLSLFCLGSLWAACAETLVGIILGRALQGMGAVGSVVMAMVADHTRETVRLRAMAVLGITIGLAFGLAFLLGPFLSRFWGLTGLFWMSFSFGLVAIIILNYLPEATFPQKREISPALRETTFSASSMGYLTPLLPSFFGVFVLHASLTALFLKIPLWVGTLEFVGTETWRFYLPILILSFIATISLILVAEKFKKFKIMQTLAILSLMMAEGLFWLGSENAVFLSIGLWLFFTGFNFLEASLPSHLSKTVGLEKRGRVFGLFSTLQFLGLFLGGLVGGAIDGSLGGMAVILFCVILTFLWLLWNLLIN